MFDPSVPLFTGCASALVTPFLPSGALDEPALRRLIRLQEGMDALIVLGTTGEPCALNMQERERVIEIALEDSGMPVIVGTGSNDTRRAIEYARQARSLGAQGQLSVTPYYNKATPAGLLRHFSAILDSCELPMILYNVPSRTGLHMDAETIAQLAIHPGIVGIKEASGDLSLAADIIARTDSTLPIYCGNDDLILPMMAMGASGAISVVANILPTQTRAIVRACQSGCLQQAQAAQKALTPLIRALFTQVNPIPVKAALAMMGLIHEELRLPLSPMDYPHRAQLENAMKDLALI